MDNLRRAILVFTIVLFAATSIFGYSLALDYYDKNSNFIKAFNYDETKNTIYTGEEVSDTESLRENILVIVGDKGASETELMFVVNYDAENMKMSFLYIPKDMKYSYVSDDGSGKVTAVGRLYKELGIQNTTAKISALLDIPVEKYIFMDFEDCKEIVNRFTHPSEGVEFNFPVSVECSDLNIKISAGTQYFDGDKAVSLMRYYYSSNDEYSAEMLSYYDGTDIKRIEMVKSFTNAFMCSQFSDENANVRQPEEFISHIKEIIADSDHNIDDLIMSGVADTIYDIPSSSLYYYMLNCDTAANDMTLLQYTDCVTDITAQDSASYKTMTKEESYTLVTDNFVSKLREPQSTDE